MISTITLAEKDDLKVSPSIYKFTVFWVVMGLSEDLSVRAPKCRSDEKQHKISWNQ